MLIEKYGMDPVVESTVATVKVERLAGLNIHGFHNFQEYHKSFLWILAPLFNYTSTSGQRNMKIFLQKLQWGWNCKCLAQCLWYIPIDIMYSICIKFGLSNAEIICIHIYICTCSYLDLQKLVLRALQKVTLSLINF